MKILHTFSGAYYAQTLHHALPLLRRAHGGPHIFTSASGTQETCQGLDEDRCYLEEACIWGGVDGYFHKEGCRHISEWKGCEFFQEPFLCAKQRSRAHDLTATVKIREKCIWVTDDAPDEKKLGNGYCKTKSEACRLFDQQPRLCCLVNRWGLLRNEILSSPDGEVTLLATTLRLDKLSLLLAHLRFEELGTYFQGLTERTGFDFGTLVHFPYLRPVVIGDLDGERPTRECLNEAGSRCLGDCLQVFFANWATQAIYSTEADVRELLGSNLSFTAEVCSTDVNDISIKSRSVIVDVDNDGLEDWGCQYIYSGGRCVSADGGVCAAVLNPALTCENRTERVMCELTDNGQLCNWEDGFCEPSYNDEWDIDEATGHQASLTSTNVGSSIDSRVLNWLYGPELKSMSITDLLEMNPIRTGIINGYASQEL